MHIRHFRRTGWSLFTVLACALAAPLPARAAEMTGQEAEAAVMAAFAEQKRGNLDGVIPRLDPVIAAYEGMQAKEPSFCAENTPQTLLILARAATTGPGKTGVSTKVVDEPFCIALFLKGFVLIDLGRPVEAETFLRRAHEAEPYNAHFLNEYAEWNKMAGKWQRAHDLFAEAAEMAQLSNESNRAAVKARALRGMGYAEIELGQLDEAERHMRESQKYEPNSPAARQELDYIASMRKRSAS